jgi:FG-GAP-like repeat
MNVIYRRVTHAAFFCVLLSVAGSNARAQTYTFGTASYSAPGLSSISPPQGNPPILTADFNGDGIPDVAILGSISSGQVLSIFLGRPDASFGPRVDYSVQASGFTIGDFNGDGKADVIVLDATGSIYWGNGDGTLQPPVSLNQNIGGYSAVASGDLNGDDKLDLLVLTPNFGSGATMAVLLGNGDGTFQVPVTYSVPVAPYLVLGDFNGDGKADIAISGDGQVSVLINNGNGTFKSPVNYSLSGNIQAIAAADLNGDGRLDLVVPSGGTSATISVLLGNGDGTFGNPIEYTSNLLSIYSTSIVVADLNADGKLDLALTDSDGSANAVGIVLGNGDGTFRSPPLLYSAGLLPAAVVSLDVNGDGKPDLAVVGGYGVASYFSLTVLINQGDGTFPNPNSYPVLQFPYSAALGDFNGDGHVDIATTSITPTGEVSVLLGIGDGTFRAPVDSFTGQSPTAIAAGDFNGDGTVDLVVADSTPTAQLLSTLIGNGDGTFQNNISQILPSILRSVAVGDFNGDGKLDVAAVIDGTNAVSIFLGQGDGSFDAPVQYPTGPMLLSPPYHNVLVADFNGDGKLDLSAATDNGIAVLLGNGNGTFQPFTLVPSLLSYDPGDELVALADMNGDGKADVVKATQTGLINVALGNGDGTFQQAQAFQIPSILNTESAVVGDFNGDGKPDLAFASQSSDVVTILFANGDGTFGGHIEYSAPSVSNNVNFMLAADFNGDGALDMALADFGNGEVSVFVSRPVAAFTPRALKFASQGIDTTSPEQSLTLTNAGAAPLAITGIGASGDFAQTNDCGSSLSIGKACTVKVTFAPTTDGIRNGMLTVTDNASVVPQMLTLSGTGTGAGFQISVAPGSSASQTVTAGQVASYSLVFTPEGGFNGTLTLACSGAPTAATCTETPSSLPLIGTSAMTATINVATTGVAFASPLVPKSVPAPPDFLRLRFSFPWAGLLVWTLPLLTLLAIVAGRYRRWRILMAATMLVLIWAGCGGSRIVSTTGAPPATPAGTYTITVSATSGSLGQTLPLRLTVQ